MLYFAGLEVALDADCLGAGRYAAEIYLVSLVLEEFALFVYYYLLPLFLACLALR